MAAEEDDKQAENLVAYLDGEMDDAGTLIIEQQLASDAQVRREVERLSRTWELLDLLPHRRASHEFTEKTLTSIRSKVGPQETGNAEAATNVRAPKRTALDRGRLRVWVLRIAACLGLLVVASAGFNNSYLTGSRQTTELLRDYPLLKQLHHYSEVGDAEFLRELQKQEVFRAEPEQRSR